MSYGYEPPKHQQTGSWGEVFTITKIAFGLLLPFLGALVGLLILVVLIVILYARHPALALLPLILVAIGIAYAVRRGRRQHDDEVARIRSD